MASPPPCLPRSAPCRSPPPPEPPLRVKVVGLFTSSSFQRAKSAAESLKSNYPSKFEDPIIVPLQEFAWDQYLQEKKREFKNEIWEYSSYVMCFVNDQLLGDAADLQKWAHKMWDIVDVKPPELYEALTVDYSAKYLRDTKHDFVFLDISIDFHPIGRLIFELYSDACPKTCRNFKVLCTGKVGYSQSGIKLHYVGSVIHRVVPNGWIQGGDIAYGKGDDGESIYGPTFEVKKEKLSACQKHSICPSSAITPSEMKTFQFLIIKGEFLEWPTKAVTATGHNSTSHCNQRPI
ncbi:probable inactive peptidyl-prolyl cis-trans isomerase-like 6 isoform X3 [Canis lupus familiaris]|uniref:probable inactive peptidyl-prolyl cis-trans isomerase-like 6 isoform X3 n=1 Tax=Canis lupus dingo TaxID=286419 RepID=UPI000DC6B1B5|nr:probable inactive peptidyl-prolyl cis-trans isomerase-like 6 isoform X3 [Canis lupus dingo]XP_025300333.3 probable inactive peptidyl-prolyl cis-trans isomerase-like 6 isoform X3 [Canis lupus dingo]XP_038540381.1 probable inactive peptidyl-prolyl cis-trans isomerase-like 6 isoform X3 [Canis lupus familiaris]XP_038540387.1 probable inactive peptidyl-prolyl cis-trans isomerase-like 6 isoform X3 [Canis lupus familiaris]XP_038540392.1 probable inactive peptidyl-prolyl cis-trans isomerase-like 6 i